MTLKLKRQNFFLLQFLYSILTLYFTRLKIHDKCKKNPIYVIWKLSIKLYSFSSIIEHGEFLFSIMISTSEQLDMDGWILQSCGREKKWVSPIFALIWRVLLFDCWWWKERVFEINLSIQFSQSCASVVCCPFWCEVQIILKDENLIN